MEFFGPLIAGALGVIIVLFISIYVVEEGVRRGMRKARADERAENAEYERWEAEEDAG